MISDELLWAIFHFVAVVSIVALFFFVIMPRVTRTIKIPPRYNGNVPSGDIGTFNGIGISLLGEFRYDIRIQTYVTYEFVSLIIPLFPTNCYRVRLIEDYRINHKRSTQKFHIYGTEKWHWFEVLSIYLMGFSGIALLVVFINLMQAIF